MADAFTLRNYRAYHHVTDVFKVASLPVGVTRIAKGSIVAINGSTFALTDASASPAIGDILVTRDYPDYNIPLGRYIDHLQTPIATSTGEIVGIKLRAGDVVIKEADKTLIQL